MNVKGRHDASYFLTLIDDYSRYGYVNVLMVMSIYYPIVQNY